MDEIRVLAKSAEEAIGKIRDRAFLAHRGSRYVVVRRNFWWVVWALVCLGIALGLGRPLAAVVLVVIPLSFRFLGRLLKSVYGLLLLALVVAFTMYQLVTMVPKIGRFLEGTTFKFISGDGARIIPHSGDVVRLYAQDDFFIGARLKTEGETVYPGERLLIADFAKEVVELAQLQEQVRPREAYVDLLLSQHLRERRQTRTELKVRELERQQVGFEKEQFESQTPGDASTLDAYRKLLGRGMISKREFREVEREYERLKTSHAQLGLKERQLSAELGGGKTSNVLEQEFRYEKAQTDFLKFRTESQREWLTHLAYVAAPGRAKDRDRANGGVLDANPGGVALSKLSESMEPGWSHGELIHLAGSRSTSQVKRGQLVAEIWVGTRRKRIGLELPRAKMVGVEIGSPVNFMLDEEVADFDAVVYGRVEKIRAGSGSTNFWIEAGSLTVAAVDRTLDDFPVGVAGSYRIGLHPISHKEKYLKIKDDAQSLGAMFDSLLAYLSRYLQREAGEDFIAEPPAAFESD
jgi:multidrug resistance efflux pump